jgi:CheY-like chemotaxis protein
MMPDMDGLEAASIIKNNYDRNTNTPIVAFTANSVAGMKELFLRNNMSDYISKPIDIRELNRVLRDWLPKTKIIEESADDIYTELINTALYDRLKAACGIDCYKTLKNLEGNEQIYLSVLETFISTLNNKLEKLNQSYKTMDIDMYRIEVHSLKSSLANIGADELSDEARRLEVSSRNNNIDYINERHFDFASGLKSLGSQMKAIMARYSPADPTPRVAALSGDLVSLSEAREELNQVLNDLDMLDVDSALTVVSGLMRRLNLSDEDEKLLSEIKLMVESFEYDRAAELINKAMTKD